MGIVVTIMDNLRAELDGDLARAERVARRIHTGNVSINNVLATQANSGLPFGGVKASGVGRSHGPDALKNFSERRHVAWQRFNIPFTKLLRYPYRMRFSERLMKMDDVGDVSRHLKINPYADEA